MASLEQLTKMSLSKKVAILVFAMILTSVVYWFQFYSTSSEELDTLVNRHAELLKQRDDAHRRKSTYDTDVHRRDELKKSHAQQLRALPKDAEMSSFLASLNTQAELVGLELSSVKPDTEEAAQYYARIPVELKLRGSYLQLAKFFYLVGNVDRIINIENISFTVSSLDDSGVQLEAKVLATTFRSVEGGNAPPNTRKKV